MGSILQFIKKQWFSLVLLAGVALGVSWAVNNLRPRGSMTVIEAQAMDMTAMKAPTGVFPVGVDKVHERLVGSSATYPATLVAFSDEDVVARVAGLVEKVFVYPGDKVKAGQVLAKLSAQELDSKSQAGSLAASASALQARAASSVVQEQKAAANRARSEVKTAQSRVATAQANLKSAQARLDQARNASGIAAAAIDGKAADVTYAQAEYKREQKLYDGAAISRNELEQAKRDLDNAVANLAASKAALAESRSKVTVEEHNVVAAQTEIASAQSGLATAKAMVIEAEAGVARAQDQASAAQAGASASAADAAASTTLADYLELRALSDGVVSDRVVSPGTPVMPGQVVLRLKSDSRLRVQADLPQSLESQVHVGSPARVRTNGHVVQTKITSVFPIVEGGSRTFRVEALIDNPHGSWDVGSYSEIEVFADEPTMRLAVENGAVKTASDGSNYVWVVHSSAGAEDANADYTCTMHPQVSHKGPGECPICHMDLVPRDARGGTSVERRTVTVGVHDGTYIEIKSGLKAGDEVTVHGDDELFPMAAVKPVEWGKDGPMELPSGSGHTDMPGMDMSGSSPAQSQPDNSMPGMDMSGSK